MSEYEFFSKRLAKMMRAAAPDVYRYDVLPGELRIQVVHLWRRAVPTIEGDFGETHSEFWEYAQERIAEEHALWSLGRSDDPQSNVETYFVHHKDHLAALDVLEFVFYEIERGVCRKMFGTIRCAPEDAIRRLNRRFEEHAVGYRFGNGQLLRVDSQYVHSEAVLPALVLLSDPAFLGPQDEFMAAHRLYREGDLKAALVEANKAFESTMKAICDQRRIPYGKDAATAAVLVKALMDGGLVPAYLDSALGSLRTLLSSLVPTIRSKNAAHGQGAEVKEVSQHLAAYALHVTASTIVMLVEAHKANPPTKWR